MGRYVHWVLAVAVLTAAAGVRADEGADKIAAQKKQAEENWSEVEAGDMASVETAHLLVFAPKASEKNLKEFGAYLEKHYDQAAKVLGYDAKKVPWEGKLAVYLFPERAQFQSFIRRVEKRRFEAGDVSSHSLDRDKPHVAAGPPANKDDFAVEAQAAQQVATAMLQVKAGAQLPLPDFLLTGFGRATTYHVTPTDKVVVADRKTARDAVAKKRTAKAVYNGTVDADEFPSLAGALADMLAYGPGTSKFGEFLKGFQPEDNGPQKTTENALEAAGLKLDKLENVWKTWVAAAK